MTWKPVQIIFPWTKTKFQHSFWSCVQQSKPNSATAQLKAYLTELLAQCLDRYEWTALNVSLLYQHSNKNNSRNQRGSRSYTLGWFTIHREFPESLLSTEAAALLLGLKSHHWGSHGAELFSIWRPANIKNPQILILKQPFKEASYAIKHLDWRTTCTTDGTQSPHTGTAWQGNPGEHCCCRQ